MLLKSFISSVLLLRSNTATLNLVKSITYNTRPCSISFTGVQSLANYRTNVNTAESGNNEEKAKIISSLKFRSAEDALPFYKLPLRTLIHIYKTSKRDQINGFCHNRLYHISSRIKCSPSTLSERLAKRTFVYALTFDWLDNSLNVLLEMGVSGDRILRDLWVLKYHHETIRNRLQRVKDLGVDNLYPWMVRCSEDILNRSITISQEIKHILGDTKSTHIYLANRLNTSLEAVEEMCIKMPALKTMRVIKVKHFLDYLISEGFEVEDIANKPRILSASQKTVKQRLEKLRALGLNEINLNVLCRSRKGFKKFCESIESGSKKSDDDHDNHIGKDLI